jgi:hypothetical protein
MLNRQFREYQKSVIDKLKNLHKSDSKNSILHHLQYQHQYYLHLDFQPFQLNNVDFHHSNFQIIHLHSYSSILTCI